MNIIDTIGENLTGNNLAKKASNKAGFGFQEKIKSYLFAFKNDFAAVCK